MSAGPDRASRDWGGVGGVMQAVKDQGPAGIWPVCTRGRQNRTQAADGRGLALTDGGRKVETRVQRGEIIRGENTLSGDGGPVGFSLSRRPTKTDRGRWRPTVAMSAMSAPDPKRTFRFGWSRSLAYCARTTTRGGARFSVEPKRSRNPEMPVKVSIGSLP